MSLKVGGSVQLGHEQVYSPVPGTPELVHVGIEAPTKAPGEAPGKACPVTLA
jgi:hypothetical protein